MQTIETLLEKITPLPWEREGLEIKTERGVIAPFTLPTKRGVFDVQENAAYVQHAANSLPKLLEALERTRKHWEGRDCGAQWYQDLEEALTQAREVKG